ncbi:hypothetical protein CAPTEDRAFT_229365 [Capitella teleta]|uniref:Netrin receptor UNC5A-D-like N-terminal domain-containing protein n=1 Tax=Capitella teleta TaxID=283909 RepID=R7V076_CAPTE|nr:hypothetical protein CAPTEDRAFT_229365 [Capitella teleta]|eukprot:ELU09597.1 hypothetical protein CAPTEDRAFT_229365 [Capitella teleta]
MEWIRVSGVLVILVQIAFGTVTDELSEAEEGPSVLPVVQGDPVVPSADGAPVFALQPDQSYYIVRNKPVTVTCSAAPADQINFKCAGQWVRPQHQVNVDIVDPETGIKYLQTSIDVTREEVEEYFGSDGYWCECHAWVSQPNENQPRNTKSRRGLIHVASRINGCRALWIVAVTAVIKPSAFYDIIPVIV